MQPAFRAAHQHDAQLAIRAPEDRYEDGGADSGGGGVFHGRPAAESRLPGGVMVLPGDMPLPLAGIPRRSNRGGRTAAQRQ